jgi:hypothetical protein
MKDRQYESRGRSTAGPVGTQSSEVRYMKTLALSYEQFRIQPFVDPLDPAVLDSLDQTFRSLDPSNHIIGSKLSDHWIQTSIIGSKLRSLD